MYHRVSGGHLLKAYTGALAVAPIELLLPQNLSAQYPKSPSSPMASPPRRSPPAPPAIHAGRRPRRRDSRLRVDRTHDKNQGRSPTTSRPWGTPVPSTAIAEGSWCGTPWTENGSPTSRSPSTLEPEGRISAARNFASPGSCAQGQRSTSASGNPAFAGASSVFVA
jgi:hypothetical protein